MKKLTKEEQKDEAYEAYKAKTDPAEKAYNAIIDPAWEAYLAKTDPALEAYHAIIDPAWKAYLARIKEIDEQGE